MRFHALACDYDGTIAHHGGVDEATLAALERVRASGRKLLLVSGRELEDLVTVFPRLDLFDRAVLENGAVLYDPATRTLRALAEAPPPAFAERLTARGVGPISVGHVIVATWEPHQNTTLEVIHELGLELQVIFNKGAVMVLPSGVNKAFGLRCALDELGLSRHNVVAVGDAENDHAFLSVCECAVAVANALPTLAERADWVTEKDHGNGVQQLVHELIEDDLRRVMSGVLRDALCLGTDADGKPLLVQPYTAPVMIAGTSGAGKSTLATALLEQLAERDYQFCILDPEGDYSQLEGAMLFGDPQRAPAVGEILEVLAKPHQKAVANLVGIPLADRPNFFLGLFSRLLELRSHTGRPHWLVVDETHHLLPHTLDDGAFTLPREPHGMLLLTVHPESVSPQLLATVGTVVAIGETPRETLAAFAKAVGVPPPSVDPRPLAPGEGVAWLRTPGRELPPIHFKGTAPKGEHLRHVRKYAAGDLGPDRSFYFVGPDGKLNLRAQNLQVFMQIAEGVDDATWTFHLARGDVAKWFREYIKDDDLGREAEEIARTPDLSPSASRNRIKDAIDRRYSAPA
ncbi:MAG TPA: HAD-IIB family hydrolase [Nannocystaceae bacterium]|nr:HAD-IIB family hydrolase [Nannocystaceae bacterium]